MDWPPRDYVDFIARHPLCGSWAPKPTPLLDLFFIDLPTTAHADHLWCISHVRPNPNHWYWFDVCRPACATPSLVFGEAVNGRMVLGLVGPTESGVPAGRGLRWWSLLILWPGVAKALCGVDAERLVDRFVDLEPLWGTAAADLIDRLRVGQPHEHLTVLSRAAHARIAAAWSPEHELVRRALALGISSNGDTSVEALATGLDCSPRHLTRLFRRHVGMPPKRWLRTVRFERARRAIADHVTLGTEPAWGPLAEACGYGDHPHFVKEFKDLIGYPPQAFFARETQGRLIFGFGLACRRDSPRSMDQPVFDPLAVA